MSLRLRDRLMIWWHRRRDRRRAEAAEASGGRWTARRGVLLLATLTIISVMALIGASFAFQMRARFEAVNAMGNLQQAREAAMSGIDRATLLLRTERNNIDEWYNNPDKFRRILVWAEDQIGGSESLADQEKVEGRRAWRFSLVGYKVQEEGDATIRYGMTDEASKININAATREQLLRFFDQYEHENVTSVELADALIDWRDTNDDEISPHGAESTYYITLEPPYRAKNRFFESVEELLMVKGFNGRILYGEDYNRNGYLDENEDDGEEGVFPPDDGDGELDRGLLPYLTVYSWDFNSANDNKARIDINALDFGKALAATEQGAGETGGTGTTGGMPSDDAGGAADPTMGSEGEFLGDDSEGLGSLTISPPKSPAEVGFGEHILQDIRPEVLEFIAEAQKRGHTFRSVGELYGLEVYEDGSTNYDDEWKRYEDQRRKAAKSRLEEIEGQEDEFDQDDEFVEDLPPEDGEEGDDTGAGAGEDTGEGPADESGEDADEDESGRRSSFREKRDSRRQQSVNEERRRPGGGEGSGRQLGGSREGTDEASSSVNAEGQDPNQDGEDQGDPEQAKGTPIVSPVEPSDMDALMDRFTVVPVPAVAGLVNVNTASARVLKTIPGLSEEDVSSIVSKREQLSGEDKMTPAWLLSNQAVEPEVFMLISNHLTTRSLQFTIDAIGFADHVGTIRRYEAVVEMRGHVSQLLYMRDITPLGVGYPVHEDQRSEGFAFID